MSEECNLDSSAEENLEIDTEAVAEEESTEKAPSDHVSTTEEELEGDNQTMDLERSTSPKAIPLGALLESSTQKLKQINLNEEGDESLPIQENVSEDSRANSNLDRSPAKPSSPSQKVPTSELEHSPTKPSPSKEVPVSDIGRSASKPSEVLSPKTPGEKEAPAECVQLTDKKDIPLLLIDTPETPASSSRRRGRKPGQTPRAKSTPSRQPALTSPPLTRSRTKELGKMQYTPRALEEKRKQ